MFFTCLKWIAGSYLLLCVFAIFSEFFDSEKRPDSHRQSGQSEDDGFPSVTMRKIELEIEQAPPDVDPRTLPEHNEERTDIVVPYSEKDQAKDLGAWWDKEKRTWYVPGDLHLDPFEKWLPAPSKLTIELVPKTCWFSNVRSNVSKEAWKLLSAQSARKAGYKCEICGGRGPRHPVECHEIWKYDDSTRVQHLKGLISLCPDCHEVKHIGLAEVKGRSEEALAHLMKINSWKRPRAKKYVRDQFLIWQERSRSQWELDVSWLKSLGVEVVVRDRPKLSSNLPESTV